jgi:hypothetical protein
MSRNRLRSVVTGVPSWVWVAAAIALGPACLLGPGLVRGRVLFWGTPILQFYPWREFALKSLMAGHLPLWNPLVGLGAPLLANYQSALLYPPNWIQGLVGIAWGQGLLVMLHLIWAGLGMAILCQRLRLSWLASAVSGTAFGLSGYLVARSSFLPINAGVAWLPWIIVGVDSLVASKDRPSRPAYALAVAAFTCQWLAGHAQVAWYTLVLALAWATWRILKVNEKQAWLRGILRLGAVLALSFCLAAPQLLPTLEYVALSQRATSVSRDLAMTYSFWPWRLAGLLAPNLFGTPVAGDYWGYGNFWEDAIYVGILPLCLAAASVWKGLRGRSSTSSLVRFLSGVCLVSLLLALGDNTPLFPFLYDHIPTFSLFQAPTRWMLWAVFGLSLLAGTGVDDWQVAKGRALYWLRLGTAGAVAIGFGAGLASLGLRDIHPTFVGATALAGGWLAAAGALALTRRDVPGRVWTTGVVGLVVLDLTTAAWGLNPFATPDLYKPASALAERLPSGSRLYLAPDVEYRFKYDTMFRFDTFSPRLNFRQVMNDGLPNTPMISGLASANNFDPILPGRYALWMRTLTTMPAGQQARWLDAMDVGVAAFNSSPDGLPDYKVRQPPGRVWFVGKVDTAVSEADAFNIVGNSDFDPASQVVVEGPVPEGTRESSVGMASLLESNDSNALSVSTDNSGGGWLVVSAMNYPGWGARLDGQSTRLYAADYVFMAVWVPAGAHDVILEYHSRPFTVGLILAGLAWLVSGIWIFRGRRSA